MRQPLIWTAVGAALSSLAFLLSGLLIKQPKSDRKPYVIIWDNHAVPYSAEDNGSGADDLDAKRSTRIAYKCGAKEITNTPALPDRSASITVSAGENNRWVTDCIQSYVAKGEIDVRFVWLTDRQLVF